MATMKPVASRSSKKHRVYAVRCGDRTITYAHLRAYEGNWMTYFDRNIDQGRVSGFGGSETFSGALKDLREDVRAIRCGR